MQKVDVIVAGSGSVYLFFLQTPEAFLWVAENVLDDHQVLGYALAVEHRYVKDLAFGMLEDGLVLAPEIEVF